MTKAFSGDIENCLRSDDCLQRGREEESEKGTMTSTSSESPPRDPSAELTLLYKVSETLDQSLDLREVVGPILSLLDEHLGLVHSTLTLLNRQTGEISIEEAHGLSSQERARGRYKLGEGITGTVVQTGRAEIVSHIRKDPRFLDRTGAHKRLREMLKTQDLSFICVPIKLGTEVVGTLSTVRPFTEHRSPADDARLLSIIASMIAQAVKLRQMMQEEQQRLLEENARLHQELKERFRLDRIVGNSRAMQEVYDLIAQVAKSDATVLIRGESGTGKELVAHAIHYNSLRAEGPYIRVNCAALPEMLLESELFGHEKGAFTGAVMRKKGRFELASGGTLFLDEVGDLPLSTQAKLLRVIQEREFERVGGTETLRANVRLIAATNRDLEAMLREGKFREDLYYRLNVFPIHLPPLRNRKSDILLLADHFVAKYAKANGKDVRRISTPAIDMMMAYHWPGNVRELENCIERAVLLTKDQVIHSHHLPPTLQTAEASNTRFRGTLKQTLANVERELIIEALKTSRGNCTKAAAALGVTERVLGLRLKAYGIDYRRFRERRGNA